MKPLTTISTRESPRKVIAADFKSLTSELPIRGGWGYTQADACIIDKNDPVVDRTVPFDGVALEYLFVEKRIYEEMIIFRSDGEKFSGIRWNLDKQDLVKDGGRSFDRLVFDITAFRDADWEQLKAEYDGPQGHGASGFDEEAHERRRQEKMVRLTREFWFDITSFYGQGLVITDRASGKKRQQESASFTLDDEFKKLEPTATSGSTSKADIGRLVTVFVHPYEITQFWASSKFDLHSMELADTPAGKLTAYLVVVKQDEGPWKDGYWFLQLDHGQGTNFVGEFLPPFLPTRENIFVLHRDCTEMAKVLNEYDISDVLPSNLQFFTDIVRYSGDVSRDLMDKVYQADLWKVLSDDWGMALPSIQAFGKKDVVLTYRDGLPCGPAMVNAVEPLIQETRGVVRRGVQSMATSESKLFGVVEYGLADGAILTQRFDISDFRGRNLPEACFNFQTPRSASSTVRRPGKKWWQFWN
jgi:hypothetical protein